MGGASKFLILLSTPFPLIYRRPSSLRLARDSRVHLASLSSVAATTSFARRRLLPSVLRPRPGFSVRAAEEVHTQAVAREGYGDPVAREGYGDPLVSPPNSRVGHPWPEWSKLVDYLMARGYSDRRDSVAAGHDDDSFLDHKDLSEEFVKDAEACMAFARDQPDLLRLLPKKDLKVIVENGSPFLFRNGANSTRRLRSFLSGDEANVLESAMAQTVDVMRYLLSYACNHPITLDENYLKARELIEASVRNLLVELVNVSSPCRESSSTESAPRQAPLRHEQFSRPLGQNIEMKRGDWICPTCSFMNFARNMRCLECNEARPKTVLTGGEWECPQCDFFNYGRNMSCLRCDCKRPGGTSVSTAAPGAGLGYGRNSNVEQILNRSGTDKSEIERKLAANDEKAERWFSKVSQLDDSSDLSSTIADEDFPEIMPMRKGVNRFVVSTRKTPLERRLANAQRRGNLGNTGSLEGNESQPGGLSGMGSDKTSESSIGKTLDRILGRSTPPGTDHQSVAGDINDGAGNRFNSSEFRQSMANQRRDPDYVPFVPLPADTFSKSQNSNNDVQQFPNKEDSTSMKTGQLSESVATSSGNLADSKNDNESSDASERWSKRVAELNNVTDLPSAVSDDDFPEIMPMRKGENRFVISKKKDRSLTSPQYKRRIALEQANNSNFVPFVPFPPDYFAKKDKQPEASQTAESTSEGAAPPEKVQIVPEKSEEAKTRVSNFGSAGNTSQWPDSQPNNESHSTDLSGKTCNESKADAGYGGYTQKNNSWNNSKEGWNSEYTQKSAFDGGSSTASSPQKSEYSQNSRESWNQGFSGKSLEGSAVKEPDPLDMSEEAKAERWFRRVAQIKDISELSNIPDEDFPEIMPMRKGVNRFVVSKRKTPLERRLTSHQYRRNLPIVSSEPEKDGN